MTLQEVKNNLNRPVKHKTFNTDFLLQAVILRKSEKGYFYQAEILDTRNKNSILIVSLEDILAIHP